MSAGLKITGLIVASVLCLPVAGRADTQTTTHRARKAKKQAPLPPPLPSGTQGPVPQIPLDAMPAVAPQVTYQDGLLTIVAPNSTLPTFCRAFVNILLRKLRFPLPPTNGSSLISAPGPARDVVAELLNGSHFNYILLGSPDNAAHWCG